jgi:hypothetical protein
VFFHRVSRLALGAFLLASLLAPGCEEEPLVPDPDRGTGPKADSVVPDFSLRDVNPESPTSGQLVSPRQFEGKISAWYFGHAT